MYISIRRVAARALLALAFASVPLAHARAQAPAAADTRITGVGGFAWGTTAAAIRTRRGEPMAVMPQDEGVQALVYEDLLLGEKVMVLLFVHPRLGLFRGGYISEAPTAARCEYTLDLFRAAMERRYDDLPHDEASTAPDGVAPCEAFVAGAGGYGMKWTDERSGTGILLMLVPGQQGVMLMYTTREANEWERRKGANRL